MESGLSKDVERPEEELILVLFSIVSISGIFLCVAPSLLCIDLLFCFYLICIIWLPVIFQTSLLCQGILKH